MKLVPRVRYAEKTVCVLDMAAPLQRTMTGFMYYEQMKCTGSYQISIGKLSVMQSYKSQTLQPEDIHRNQYRLPPLVTTNQCLFRVKSLTDRQTGTTRKCGN